MISVTNIKFKLLCACNILFLLNFMVFSPVANARLLTGYDDVVMVVETPSGVDDFKGRASLMTGYTSVPTVENVAMTEKLSHQIVRLKRPVPKFTPLLTRFSIGVEQNSEAVDLQADSMSHDEATDAITASGNVELTQDGRTLQADKITYDLQNDVVIASGNVVLHEQNGDIHYADRVELRNKMKDGFVENIRTLLNDGSRFTASKGERIGGVSTVMRRASYTPCEICKENPEKAPVWQIVGSKITHNMEKKQIEYKHARFEVAGVPVAYVPYFSHPDGSIKQKSGLLAPSAGFKSRLGAFVQNSYYWAIGEDKDATIGVAAYTDENPMVSGQYRQRWSDASLVVEGSATSSERVARIGDLDVLQDEEFRGHFFAEGRWDIDEKWRGGVDVQVVTDDQYLRQYDFEDEDVLESQLYLERFAGRDYFSARAIGYQDLRIGEDRGDQPDVLPEISTSIVGDPNSVPVVGGTWSLDGSYLGLRRSGDDQDYDRISFAVGWDKYLVSDFGLLTTVQANLRGDFYNTRDRDVAALSPGKSEQSTDSRIFPQIHAQASYPMERKFEKYQATIEPVLGLTFSSNVDTSNEIPNEDSQDVQIDSGNIFEANRFSGLDRVEDRSKVTYGMKAGVYGYDGSYANLFLGQSRRFNEDGNPFPVGSGFENKNSDYVGQISTQYKGTYGLDYRFQLDNDGLASKRHEVDGFADWNRFRLGARYLFAKGLAGTALDTSREQLNANAQYYINKSWRIVGGGIQDLGEVDAGLREAYVGLDYLGQCLSWSVVGRRNLTNASTGDGSTELLFKIGLKNIGEFVTSGLRPSTRDK